MHVIRKQQLDVRVEISIHGFQDIFLAVPAPLRVFSLYALSSLFFAPVGVVRGARQCCPRRNGPTAGLHPLLLSVRTRWNSEEY